MSKNIVLCADGTGQKSGVKKSNVVRLFTLLDLGDPKKQIGCYDQGVGTIPEPEVVTAVSRRDPGVIIIPEPDPPSAIFRFFTVLAGQAVGCGLTNNVKQMYNILIDHYAEGDQIYLFGFSRGAFTVRVLAGLLYRCGLLLPENKDRVSEAFELYKPHFEALENQNPEKLKKLKEAVDKFKTAFAQLCEVRFLGVWDTVKSFGYLLPKSLPHTRRNPIVKTVRHALSIDERRSFFVPTSWGGLDADTQPVIEGQDVQEVWFAGSHSDVGGGYAEAESDLAKISLKWIINEAYTCGLLVDKAKYQEMLDQDSIPTFTPHDELKKWRWRISEHLPRWELENDPPPPRRLFKWGPTGRRPISKFARNGEVLIDSDAREFYSTKVIPWSDLDSKKVKVKFVDTVGNADV